MNTDRRTSIDYDFHRNEAHRLRQVAMRTLFARLVRRLRRASARPLEIEIFHQPAASPRQ